MNELKKQIRFCTSADATRIAHALSGEGSLLELRVLTHTVAE